MKNQNLAKKYFMYIAILSILIAVLSDLILHIRYDSELDFVEKQLHRYRSYPNSETILLLIINLPILLFLMSAFEKKTKYVLLAGSALHLLASIFNDLQLTYLPISEDLDYTYFGSALLKVLSYFVMSTYLFVLLVFGIFKN